MVFQIVIAGESQCEKFAQVCLIADYLAQNLPNFCYKRIEKPVLEWKPWLCKINQKNNWHHVGSFIVWKELLMDGSKSYYIGGASEFFEYCQSYYNFDIFAAPERFQDLVNNFAQLQRKHKRDQQLKYMKNESTTEDDDMRKSLTVCISGATIPIAMHIVSGLLDMLNKYGVIGKIFLYDMQDRLKFLEFVERECNYVGSNNPAKVVKCVERIGIALTTSDLLIILDHFPFQIESSIGSWLYKNKKLMESLAFMINASATPKMCILLPNLGPACYNATILRNAVTNIKKSNIVVATSDLGLDVAFTAAKIAEIPMRLMFCPPVWGFVGINHLVDIRTTIHKYNSLNPLTRFTKVRDTTLCIGTVTPEMRTMEYLFHFDESLWLKVAEKNVIFKIIRYLLRSRYYTFIKREDKLYYFTSHCDKFRFTKSTRRLIEVLVKIIYFKKGKAERQDMSKAVALINTIKSWFIDSNPNNIISLGVSCDGSFGLSFNGIFSQPAYLSDGIWKPEKRFFVARDPQVSVLYLEKMAKIVMELGKNDLPHHFSSE